MLSAKCAQFLSIIHLPCTKLVSLRPLSLSGVFEFRRKQRGRSFTRPPINRFTEEDAEFYEALEHFVNQDGSEGHGLHLKKTTEALIHRELRQQQRKVKKKIMEQKFFKPPQETNLLTWNAKQQIRYLHEEFPDKWTPEQLAESFPVSLEGVQRLLKSSYTPRSEEEVAKHDKRVAAHWRQLKETLALEGGPAEEGCTKFQQIIDAGKLPLMINAGGSPQLPAPRPRQEARTQGQKKMGLFESLVAGPQGVTAPMEEAPKWSEGPRDGQVTLLREIAEFRKSKRKARPVHFLGWSKNQT